ncbi:LysR family transcriptional regulator [Pendulispora albinea]|uniref:LysR family transcriptional regulator n=1 Tax=Pendulispora albinea TaxID=2741071 RepID=A0ABZ2LSU7_9BACT
MFINYELLRTLLEVGQARTFAEAARRLRVTPSAVSHQLRTLQAQLDVVLFERVGRRAQLTPAGQVLVRELRASFARIDDALLAVTSDSRAIRGRVRLGGPGPFSRMWLRPRLLALFEAYPELVIDARFDIPSVLTRQLTEGELDLALIVRTLDAPALEMHPVYIEEFVAVASPRRFKRKPETARELAEHPFVVFDDDLAMHATYWASAFGRGEPLPPKIICRITSLDEMLALATEGVAIAVLPQYFVADAIKAKAVVLVGPSGTKRTRARNTIYLAWRKGVVETARLKVVREALLSGADSPRPDGRRLPRRLGSA